MKKPIVLVLSTLMLSISATAMADTNHRWDNNHGRDHDRYEHRDRDDRRHDYRNDHRAPNWSNADRGKHYGRYVEFKRGDRIPAEYRNSRYYVSDWRSHRLYEPPRGYRWVKTPNQYLLVDSKHQIYRVR
ncbi:RcnB family protein [Acinetobacter calcoaceticus]|uniref:RcnB family protein n=1 Tax=Acinetobacter calcoaceticus TaxID=471 RepID=UPI0022723696|nr:RcnB family protein [Acinetobacter calcoaceticus]GLG82634.1 hypothetical protein ACSO1_11560 [Acinetobacter calcoaceticus]